MSVRRVFYLLIVSLCLVCTLFACAQPAAPGGEADVQEADPSDETAANDDVAIDAAGGSFPITIDNCGLEITYEAPPAKSVAMNQAATEIMLALGLEDSMTGTAYMDDEILPPFADAYASVPVLATEYPSQEVLFAAEPDFVYGVYGSAFGDEAAGPRDALLDLGIGSYLSEVACDDVNLRPEQATFSTVFDEIRHIGAIFGVADRAEALVAEMQTDLDGVMAAVGNSAEPISIFWYDSGDDEPFAGACCGTANMVIEAARARNIFDDVEGNWATVSWEEVIARDPDVIVVVDADWSLAQDKTDWLLDNPALASIRAVQEERFVVIPFSATTLGVRNVRAVETLAAGLYPERFE